MNNVTRTNLYFFLTGLLFAALFLVIYYCLADGQLFDLLRDTNSAHGTRGGGLFR
ncbi:MAG: hypothetical protein LBK60_03555 [Verrucomicrobiales bacterium]|nr:hypothetical protein [Verrucomicrobiales bacterium]